MTTFAHSFTVPRLRSARTANPSLVFESLKQAGVTGFYPGFRPWFFGKVVPGLETGERRIFLQEARGMLAGVAICKRSGAERKLCTLWVEPSQRNRGIAGELAQRAFEWLGSDQPLFTVPEERWPEFVGLTRSWRFSEPVSCRSLYREERTEYIFNGLLESQLSLLGEGMQEVAQQTVCS